MSATNLTNRRMAYMGERHIAAMQAAWIEARSGVGTRAAVQWIENTLAPAGMLPPPGISAQDHFDAEMIRLDLAYPDVTMNPAPAAAQVEPQDESMSVNMDEVAAIAVAAIAPNDEHAALVAAAGLLAGMGYSGSSAAVIRAADTIAAPRGTDAQILKERELTASTIMGAIGFGYLGNEPPPEEAAWLRPFYDLGKASAAKDRVAAAPKAVFRPSAKASTEMIAAAEGVEDLYRRGTPETWGKVWAAMHAAADTSLDDTFQRRVQPWMMACFGEMIAGDREERNHRFFEEATELVQSTGMTRSEAHQLVDYVYGRPVGEPKQEVGGVMVTLAALCLANDMDMHVAAEVELARIWTMVEKIRAKQAAKPKHSPLPEAVEGAAGEVASIAHLRASRERRAYVAGPMTGLPLYNFPAFDAAADKLRADGWQVENPADHGVVDGADHADYMRWDITRMATCGAIYLLPNWERSKGATLEVTIAEVLGMTVLLAPGATAPADVKAKGDPSRYWDAFVALLNTIRPVEGHPVVNLMGGIDGYRTTFLAAAEPLLDSIPTQIAKSFFAMRWDEAALRKSEGATEAVPAAYIEYLQTQAPREGFAGNEVWNAAVAWARASAGQ